MRRFVSHPLLAPLAGLVAALAVACSSPVATVLPPTDGWGPSGGTHAGSTSASSSGGSTSSGGSGGGEGTGGGQGPSGSSSGGAASSGGASSGVSSSGASPSPEAGAPSGHDAGTSVDAGPPKGGSSGGTQGPLGSCTNPICGTDLNECGCQATDSAGNTVQLGCQAGGDCVCLVNQQTDGQPFPENGACNDPPSTVAQFLTNCTCQ
jgi:hypothetical protein